MNWYSDFDPRGDFLDAYAVFLPMWSYRAFMLSWALAVVFFLFKRLPAILASFALGGWLSRDKRDS